MSQSFWESKTQDAEHTETAAREPAKRPVPWRHPIMLVTRACTRRPLDSPESAASENITLGKNQTGPTRYRLSTRARSPEPERQVFPITPRAPRPTPSSKLRRRRMTTLERLDASDVPLLRSAGSKHTKARLVGEACKWALPAMPILLWSPSSAASKSEPVECFECKKRADEPLLHLARTCDVVCSGDATQAGEETQIQREAL